MAALVSALESVGFYVPGVEDILSGRMRTLQIIHQETVMQADLILSGEDSWDTVKFERRRLEGDLYFISPEDIVLSKLLWRKRSRSETPCSETEWRDILGVLKVQRERLDLEYLREWADSLAMSDDLTQAFREADVG